MNNKQNFKHRIFNIIQIGNKDDTISRSFDIFIVFVIITNILVMFLETFEELKNFNPLFQIIEIITILIFCIEYVLRIWTAEYLYPNHCKKQAIRKFLLSYDGVIDLLTILPFFFLSGFVVFRMLRVVRIFHLFRINAQYDSFNIITTVLYEKKNQILSSTFIIVILMFASSLCMYSAEHNAQPNVFRNAFSGLWWAMSTLLTVGYGDIYPITLLGRTMAIIIAFLGVGVVAIPTGIISAGFVEQYSKVKNLNDIEKETPMKFVSFKINRHHNWKNCHIKDVDLPQGLTIVMILRKDDIVIPNGDVKFIENDMVIVGAISYIDEKGLKLEEVIVDKNNKWCEKQIKDLDISRLTTIVSIKRKNNIIIPYDYTQIKENDIVILYKNKDGSR